MNTIAHLKYKLENSHSTPHTQLVPGYKNIQLLRSKKNVLDRNLLTKDVHFLKDIKDPKDFAHNLNVKILHAHHGNLGILLRPFAAKASTPLVCSFRGKDTIVSSKEYREDLKKLFKDGARFFPVCNHLAERIVDLGCRPEKINVLYGGIDLKKFSYIPPTIDKEEINILSIGRLVEKKGHHLLMKAFHKIKDKYPTSKLTIIGKGKYKENLVKLANKLKLGSSISIYDQLPYEKVANSLKSSDIFVAASLTGKDGDIEGIPNTLKEAMATGRPCISTYHAGIPELVKNKENGILVKENSVSELAEALEYMMENKQKWNKYSKNARKTIENKFNLDKQLQLQSSFYTDILKG